MDLEKLIGLVNERQPLWDMRDKKYHIRDIQRKLWTEVAKELDSEVEEVKKKWKGLRDVFRRKHKKYNSHKSGDGATMLKTWAYYDIMLFISDTVEQRELHGNVSPKKDDSQYAETVEEANSQQETHLQHVIHSQQSIERVNIEPQTNLSTTSKRKKPKKNSIDDQFFQIEREKLQIYSENSAMKADSDYLFLISLFPFLKRVPIHRKMAIRNKLQQVFIDEEELALRASLTPSPASFTSESSHQNQQTFQMGNQPLLQSFSDDLPSSHLIANKPTPSKSNEPLLNRGLQQYFTHFNSDDEETNTSMS